MHRTRILNDFSILVCMQVREEMPTVAEKMEMFDIDNFEKLLMISQSA